MVYSSHTYKIKILELTKTTVKFYNEDNSITARMELCKFHDEYHILESLGF